MTTARPPADVSDPRGSGGPSRPRRSIVLALVVLAAAAIPLARGITLPFLTFADRNTAAFAQPARNYLRHGLIATRLGMAADPGATRPPYFAFNAHHPPGHALAAAGLFAVLGVHEWSARLWPALCSLGSAQLVFLLWRRARGDVPGALAAVMAASLPAFGHFGKMLGEEAPTLFFGLLTIHLYLGWADRAAAGERASLVARLPAYAAACVSGWAGFHAGPILMADAAIRLDGSARRRALLGIGATGLLCIAAILAHLRLLVGTLDDILDAAIGRLGGGGSAASLLSAPGPWLTAEAEHAVRIFGIGTVWATGAGLAAGAIALLRRRADMRAARVLLILVAFGVAHPLVFRQAAYHHDWLLFHLIPVLGIASAEAALLAGAAAAAAARALGGPPRAAAAALLIATALPAIAHATASAAALGRLMVGDRQFGWTLLGRGIAARAPEGRWVLTNLPRFDATVRFYADRRYRTVLELDELETFTAASLYARDLDIPMDLEVLLRLESHPHDDLGSYRLYDLTSPGKEAPRWRTAIPEPAAAPLGGGAVDASFDGVLSLDRWSAAIQDPLAEIEPFGRLVVVRSQWRTRRSALPSWSFFGAVMRRQAGEWASLLPVAQYERYRPSTDTWSGAETFTIVSTFLLPRGAAAGEWEVRLGFMNAGRAVTPTIEGRREAAAYSLVAGLVCLPSPGSP